MEKLSIKLAEGKISYLSGGQGKNMILLHSLNLSAKSWDPQVDQPEAFYKEVKHFLECNEIV